MIYKILPDVQDQLVNPEKSCKSCLNFYRQHLADSGPVTRTTDSSGPVKVSQLKPEPLIQLNNPRRRLIRDHHWPGMRREEPRGAHLIIPRKAAGTVRRELYIIRRIRIHEISSAQLKLLDVNIAKFPLPEHGRIIREVARVVDRLVRPEGHVEIAAFVETTKTIEARAVQIVEQLRAFFRVRLATTNQAIEALALSIEKLLVVPHPHAHAQTILHVTIEVDEVRVDVVQQRLLRLQSKHHREPAAKRFEVATFNVRFQ